MRIDAIIPDRGDRPQFLENCKRMLYSQTFQKKDNNILVISSEASKPKSEKCDITFRYRTLYDTVREDKSQPHLIALIENDDWYDPTYLEYMAKKWLEVGQPDLFGTNYTIYYHLKLKKYFTFRHVQRSSAMSTFIKPGLKLEWPADHDPYTDQWLWIREKGIETRISIEPEYIICVGMKHGIGMPGGDFHNNYEDRFRNDDNGFLQNTLDPDSYKFYSSIVFL